MKEIQLTYGNYGHMLNGAHVFSPDDDWIVYDTRNDQTHIGRTCCIEKVNTETGEVVKLYAAPGQSAHGPGVGAAAWHPREQKVIFIHGLMNCNESRPYGFTRRFGALLYLGKLNGIAHAEARMIDEPLLEGALRGGTHAYSWSHDGKWISFTYNDFVMEQLEKAAPQRFRDLRTIGVMAPVKAVMVQDESAENFSGEYFSVVAATVTDHPRPGSEEIEKAFDECWVGHNGYIKPDGSRQRRAIAFQGNVKVTDDSVITEVFVADLPEDITRARPGQTLAGTMTTRPTVPEGLTQRRVTFTQDRKYPGIQGPRAWLRASPDGAHLYCTMKDDNGIAQIFEVNTNEGTLRQVTNLPASVDAQFNVSPDGKAIALIADNSVWLADLQTGSCSRVTEPAADDDAPVLAVVWDNRGNAIAYNRYVRTSQGRHLQIFTIAVN